MITVNDYLAERDAEMMMPVYAKLGLTVGFVKQGLDPESRKAAYRCDITYCSNKEIAFDYLRDRLALGGKARPIATKLARLEKEGGFSRIESGIRREKTVAWLLEKAQVSS